jgi:hypothetical protein
MASTPLPPEPPPVAPDGAPLARDPAPIGPPPVAVIDEAHRLPPHRSKLTRVQDHLHGTVNGLTEWMELRIAIIRREVEEAIEAKKHQAEVLGKAWGVTAVLGLAAALMALFFLGFLFSALWGLLLVSVLWSLALGYLTLVVLLGVGALVAMRRAKAAGARLQSPKRDS